MPTVQPSPSSDSSKWYHQIPGLGRLIQWGGRRIKEGASGKGVNARPAALTVPSPSDKPGSTKVIVPKNRADVLKQFQKNIAAEGQPLVATGSTADDATSPSASTTGPAQSAYSEIGSTEASYRAAIAKFGARLLTMRTFYQGDQDLALALGQKGLTAADLDLVYGLVDGAAKLGKEAQRAIEHSDWNALSTLIEQHQELFTAVALHHEKVSGTADVIDAFYSAKKAKGEQPPFTIGKADFTVQMPIMIVQRLTKYEPLLQAYHSALLKSGGDQTVLAALQRAQASIHATVDAVNEGVRQAQAAPKEALAKEQKKDLLEAMKSLSGDDKLYRSEAKWNNLIAKYEQIRQSPHYEDDYSFQQQVDRLMVSSYVNNFTVLGNHTNKGIGSILRSMRDKLAKDPAARQQFKDSFVQQLVLINQYGGTGDYADVVNKASANAQYILGSDEYTSMYAAVPRVEQAAIYPEQPTTLNVKLQDLATLDRDQLKKQVATLSPPVLGLQGTLSAANTAVLRTLWHEVKPDKGLLYLDLRSATIIGEDPIALLVELSAAKIPLVIPDELKATVGARFLGNLDNDALLGRAAAAVDKQEDKVAGKQREPIKNKIESTKTLAGVPLAYTSYENPGKGSNEDRVYAAEIAIGGKQILLAGVADGHNSKQPAEYVQKRLKTLVQRALEPSSVQQAIATGDSATIRKALSAAILQLDQEIAERQMAGGTTINFVVVIGDSLYDVNLGDSRALMKAGDKAMPLSIDMDEHAPEVVQSVLLRGGGITIGSSGTARLASPYGGGQGVTAFAALGDLSYGALLKEPVITVSQIPKEGAVVAIVSDGVTKGLSHNQMVHGLSTGDAAAMAQGLVENAYQRGVMDDITAMVLTIPKRD